MRQTIELSKFGFLQKGNLTVKFSNLTIEDITQSSKVQVSIMKKQMAAGPSVQEATNW